jgi:hypothetical protein
MRRRSVVGFALIGLIALCGPRPAVAQVKKAEILKEIQDAFKTWEGQSCSGLSFKYAGEATDPSEKKDAILVYFASDSKTWRYADNAYYVEGTIELDETADLVKGVIAMNAYKYTWGIGKSSNTIDIKTAVLHMIPGAIGFYVGPDIQTENLPSFLKYDFTQHTLHPLHALGAKFTYFKSDTGCVKPDMPPICGKGGWTLDGGVPVKEAGVAKEAGVKDAAAKDAAKPDLAASLDGATKKDAGPSPDGVKSDGASDPPIRLCIHHSLPDQPGKGKPYHWAKLPVPYYVYIPSEGRIPGGKPPSDAGADLWVKTETGVGNTCKTSGDCPNGLVCADDGRCVQGPADDGCCRVSHAGDESLSLGALLLCGVVLALVWRRRRR